MSIEIEPYAAETLTKLEDPGLLLVARKTTGETNIMTIGWGFIGQLWGGPVFVVAVRHSRYTHELIEESNEFTVNIPAEGMEKTVSYCGEVSGRDHDKQKKCKLVMKKGRRLKTPVIMKCRIHYECKVVHKLELKPKLVPADTKRAFYAKRNYHTLYFGKIVAVY